jgi:hypothetical protein
MENGQRSSVDGKILSRLIQAIQPYDLSKEEVGLIKYELYNCLIVSVMHPIETQASILPHALRVFGAGVNEQSNNVSHFLTKDRVIYLHLCWLSSSKVFVKRVCQFVT